VVKLVLVKLVLVKSVLVKLVLVKLVLVKLVLVKLVLVKLVLVKLLLVKLYFLTSLQDPAHELLFHHIDFHSPLRSSSRSFCDVGQLRTGSPQCLWIQEFFL